MDTNYREYRTVDKSEWRRGAWDAEPDKVQWIDAATGLDCLMVRAGHLGYWCGYVGVPEGHAAFEKDYGYVDVRVHGGLTFSDRCADAPTRESWQTWCAQIQGGRAEAARYPRGDATRPTSRERRGNGRLRHLREVP